MFRQKFRDGNRILAVLKAGGAYVQMDSAYPQDRIDYIMIDIGAELILSQIHLREEKQIELPEDIVILIDLTE